MLDKQLHSYAPPALNPDCQCQGNPMRAHFCMTGHQLGCHFPLDCATAACAKLRSYDWEEEALPEIVESSKTLLASLADKGCEACGGGGLARVEQPFGAVIVECARICHCIVAALVRHS